MACERNLADAFIELADSLVDDYDVIDFLAALTRHSLNLVDVDAAGILLIDNADRLRVAASSSDQVRLLELFQLRTDDGPCLECFRTGAPVDGSDLSDQGEAGRWPRFRELALATGFRAVYAVPMRLRTHTIGTLNLFCVRPNSVSHDDRRLAQALADVATISILQEQAARRAESLAGQLQAALDSRIVLEQAKGVLAERTHCDMDHAFAALRDYAGRHGVPLVELARSVTNGQFDTADLIRDRPNARHVR